MDVFEIINSLQEEINSVNPDTADSIETFRIRFVGSKNVIKPLFGEIKNVVNERKREFGQVVNALKDSAEQKFNSLKEQLENKKESFESDIDVTAPGFPYMIGSRHPISLSMERIIKIFTKIGFIIAEDREIEDDWHNFTALNTPEDHPARDMQDTFYLKNSTERMLRTQTSSVQIRTMTSQKPPIRIISPGRVYRNETVSARSHCQFHQVEGLYIDKNVSFADMNQTLLYFAREMYGPETKIRLRPSYFPFTEPSAEMDVYWGLKDETDYRITKGTGWLEVLGCGMVDPAVLENCGIDPNEYTGYAFGMGIERQAMLLHRIGDIRLFFENDIRFIKQFTGAL
ncbi:MAG TPA: phenylalanine--tRNA ligase subunit alpha [Saprospiraceae bacterium]|nr:phenylalanine--tRNA ligase subunit alpha [Saprospiraceae bacterium]